jgi:hypothetical protein
LTDVVGQCIDGQDRGGFLLLSLQQIQLVNRLTKSLEASGSSCHLMLETSQIHSKRISGIVIIF